MKAVESDKVLFKKYYRALCYFAWQMVRDENMAEDLAQDAFMTYFQHKDTVSDDEQAIKSFLYSSVKFAVYNLHRKNSTVQKYWERSGFQEADDIDYEHQVIRTEFMMVIKNTLSTLPEGCRTVMTMSYLDGFSNEEIAEQLQISLNTIKTQKRRGLSVLRTKLRADYFSLVFALFVATF